MEARALLHRCALTLVHHLTVGAEATVDDVRLAPLLTSAHQRRARVLAHRLTCLVYCAHRTHHRCSDYFKSYKHVRRERTADFVGTPARREAKCSALVGEGSNSCAQTLAVTATIAATRVLHAVVVEALHFGSAHLLTTCAERATDHDNRAALMRPRGAVRMLSAVVNDHRVLDHVALSTLITFRQIRAVGIGAP